MNLNATLTSTDLNSSMLNNSIGAPTPKLVSSETTKTPLSGTNLIVPEWNFSFCFFFNFLCALCSKSIHIYPINSNLPPQIKVLFISRYELVHVTEAQVREQVYKLYSNMYKQLFDVFDYQDAKWNQLMMHRIEYLRQMNKIKKGMMELEETKRINKELLNIFQGHEQFIHQDHERYQQNIRQYQSTISPARPSSVASSTSLNIGQQQQQRQQTNHNPSSMIKPMVTGPSPNLQHHHVPPPEPDKLMTYEQAMIYAHPALKDALRLAHRRKMSSKNSGTITPK
ncbi:unnamed protein product [Rotaria sordida]|uniref:Uncharacterized protein n=1 Tax=Rotaria sordida TaxID=392033 RepID=A0A814N519_9BILA|nr:unnamed protein product [Rotaria sordida]